MKACWVMSGVRSLKRVRRRDSEVIVCGWEVEDVCRDRRSSKLRQLSGSVADFLVMRQDSASRGFGVVNGGTLAGLLPGASS